MLKSSAGYLKELPNAHATQGARLRRQDQNVKEGEACPPERGQAASGAVEFLPALRSW